MDCIVHGITKSWTRLSNFHLIQVLSRASCPSVNVAGWEHVSQNEWHVSVPTASVDSTHNTLIFNINNLRYSDDTTFMAENKEELKSFLKKVKEESEKTGLKLSIQKSKIMAFGPITSWQIDGRKMETVRDFIILGSKITANGDCSHEIKRCLFLGRKALTNRQCIKKQRYYFAKKGQSSQGYGFSSGHVWMCESWMWRKLSAEELMLLNCGVGEDSWVFWTTKRSNQSILET